MRIPISECQLGFVHKTRINEYDLKVTFEKSDEGNITFADFKKTYKTTNFEGTETSSTEHLTNLFKDFKFKITQ